MPLTELQIRHAKPSERPYKMGDGFGLYLLVQPGGSKLWRMKYHFAGKEKLLSFGPYPGLGLAAARARRTAARLALDKGVEPRSRSAGAVAAAGTTFRDLAMQWHENRKCSLDPDHAERLWARFEADVFPALGGLQMEDITPPDVLAMVRKIESRGALDISRRAKQGVGQVFQFAIACGLATSDPTAHLRGALKPRPRVKHMRRLPLRELPDLVGTIRSYRDDDTRRSSQTRDALMFALLTWVRSKELRLAVVSEFEGLDGEEPVWRIPLDRMKMRREHIVPLSRQAAAIARRLVDHARDEFVFPGCKRGKPLSANTMIYGLYRLGYHSRQTVHGFRGLASTWANEQLIEIGTPSYWVRRYHEDWVELQLAHAESNEVRGAYNSAEYLMPRRRMLQDWADFVDFGSGLKLVSDRGRAV